MADKIIVEVVKKGNIYKALDRNGKDFTSQILSSTLLISVYENGDALEGTTNKHGDIFWSRVPYKKFKPKTKSSTKSPTKKVKKKSTAKRKMIHYTRAPGFSDSKWKVFYSNGDVEIVDLCCPHCKTRGGKGYGRDNSIRPDANRCPQCGGAFKKPQAMSIGYLGKSDELEKEKKRDKKILKIIVYSIFAILYFIFYYFMFVWEM